MPYPCCCRPATPPVTTLCAPDDPIPRNLVVSIDADTCGNAGPGDGDLTYDGSVPGVDFWTGVTPCGPSEIGAGGGYNWQLICEENEEEEMAWHLSAVPASSGCECPSHLNIPLTVVSYGPLLFTFDDGDISGTITEAA